MLCVVPLSFALYFANKMGLALLDPLNNFVDPLKKVFGPLR